MTSLGNYILKILKADHENSHYKGVNLQGNYMFRKELPRVYELIDLTKDINHKSAYFHDFECSYRDESTKREIWQIREKQLQSLDQVSWEALKDKASPYLMKTDYEKAGWWHQLIETLNEARGYNYLNFRT